MHTPLQHLLAGSAIVILGLTACTRASATPTAVPAATSQAANPSTTRTAAPATTPGNVGSPTTAPATGAPTGSSTPAAAVTKINLNTATNAQLLTVPNSGDRMLREFLEYRPYTSILQFRREIGKYVNADQVAAYERYLFVPIVPNSSDADTLRQIPGVDAAIATQLIANRPYSSNDAFLSRLGRLVDAEQVNTTRGYLSQ